MPCMAWIDDVGRQRLRRGDKEQAVAGGRQVRWKGWKPAQRGCSAGRGFGGHGGDRWKVSGRRAMASVETVETEAKWLNGNEYGRERAEGSL